LVSVNEINEVVITKTLEGAITSVMNINY
jgi:hypothetical protein